MHNDATFSVPFVTSLTHLSDLSSISLTGTLSLSLFLSLSCGYIGGCASVDSTPQGTY
jgi:hypothetical protein